MEICPVDAMLLAWWLRKKRDRGFMEGGEMHSILTRMADALEAGETIEIREGAGRLSNA